MAVCVRVIVCCFAVRISSCSKEYPSDDINGLLLFVATTTLLLLFVVAVVAVVVDAVVVVVCCWL